MLAAGPSDRHGQVRSTESDARRSADRPPQSRRTWRSFASLHRRLSCTWLDPRTRSGEGHSQADADTRSFFAIKPPSPPQYRQRAGAPQADGLRRLSASQRCRFGSGGRATRFRRPLNTSVESIRWPSGGPPGRYRRCTHTDSSSGSSTRIHRRGSRSRSH